MAEAKNLDGNAHYKAGRFEKARSCYKQAKDLDPNEPKYASNLSAVLFELGRYPECVEATLSAWNSLRTRHGVDGKPATPLPFDNLAIKLATRFPKAKINAMCLKTDSGSQSTRLHPSLDAFVEEEPDIESFMKSVSTDEQDMKIKELRTCWDQWYALRNTRAKYTPTEWEGLVQGAEERLRAMNIFKSSLDPTLEYYMFGHDFVRSILDGPSRTNDHAMDMASLDEEERTKLAFLFGGTGDARHVFGTLIHLASQLRKTKSKPNVHLTLVDIHPTVLARVALLFALIQEIVKDNSDHGKCSELYAALFYVYTSMIIPGYCCDIIMDVAKSLVIQVAQGGPAYMRFSAHAIPDVVEVLRYWSNPLSKSIKRFTKFNSSIPPQRPGTSLDDCSLQPPFSAQKTSKIGQGGDGSPFQTNRGQLIKGYYNHKAEQRLYHQFRTLLPPLALMSRHPALSEVAKEKNASDSVTRAATQEIHQEWKPNPTLFDNKTEHNGYLGGQDGYPAISQNPFDTLKSFYEFALRFQDPSDGVLDKTAFSIMSRFFGLVVNALQEMGDQITIELVLGDLMSTLPKRAAGERPHDSPIKFTRMWLSNVPDYTGGVLTMAVQLLPYLHQTTTSMIMSNCLLNTMAFRSIDDICYNYTLLPVYDLPRFLGCKLLNPGSSAWGDVVLVPLSSPRPLESLASKKDLHSWLAHQLLCTLCTGNPSPSFQRVDQPNNLNAFLHLLIYLQRIGFPSHWLGDFLQSVVSNNLITDVVPYQGVLPISSKERNHRTKSRKVDLRAWQADLQVILAHIQHALPFYASPLDGQPTFDNICTYQATVETFQRGRQYGLASPFVMSTALMFFKPHHSIGVEALVNNIPSLLEPDRGFGEVSVQILLSTKEVNILTEGGKVAWKMTKSWFEKMRRERWKMVTYRTDFKFVVSEPLEIAKCSEAV